MSNNTTSAFLGSPPNTLQDYYIIRGLYRVYGLGDADPNVGSSLFPKQPANYVHETKTTELYFGLVMIILSVLITTIPRLVLRASNPGMVFGSDDWAIIVAACLSLLYPITHIMIIVQGGGGQHSWEVTYAQYSVFISLGNVCITIYYVSTGLIKVSITLFLRRIAHQASKSWKIFCDIFLATLAIYLLWALFSTTLRCTPINAALDIEVWGRLEEVPSCLSISPIQKSLSIIHVAQGMVLLCCPIVMLWNIRMGLGKKIRLFTIWAVGGLTVMGGLLFLLLARFDLDVTWGYTSILTWAAIDICFGLLTASLPVLDAIIMDAWHSTAQKLSPGSHSKDDLQGQTFAQSNSPDSGRSWTDRGGTTAASAASSRGHTSYSQDYFAQEETMESGMQLGILRRTDVEVRYSTVRPPGSIYEGGFGAHAHR